MIQGKLKEESIRPSDDLSEAWASLARIELPPSYRQFKSLCIRGLRNILAAPVTSLLSILTMGISLFLFATVLLVVENLKDLVGNTDTHLSMTLFLKDGLTDTKVKNLLVEIQKEKVVSTANYKDKSSSLIEMRRYLGEESYLLDGLEHENPLPATIEIRFNGAIHDLDKLTESFYSSFVKNPDIEHISYSRTLFSRVLYLRGFIRIGSIFLSALMLLMTGFIIGNTIKLALYAHRDEIEILSLVGADDNYIRFPYLVEGVISGFIGGIVGVLLLYLLKGGLDLAIGIFIDTQRSNILSFLSGLSILAVIISGVIVGGIGSLIAVNRFLKKGI